MKATKQRKTSLRKERVESPSTPPEAEVDDAQPVAAESGNGATLETEPTSSNESAPNPELGLVNCPQCGQKALFWNRHDRIYKCVNPECKQKFTLEEYKNKEVQRLSAKQQADQMPSSESIAGAADKVEPGATEETPSGESATEADKVEPVVAKQIPPNESVSEAADKIEPAVIEQTPSRVSTAEVKDEVQPAAIEEMSSNVSTAGVRSGMGHGAIEDTASDVATAEATDEAEDGTKSAKKINRYLALLLMGVLAAGIVVLGIFLGQKSGDLNELSSQLNKSREALAASQAQLAASQQDVTGLSIQLTQAQQEIEALRAAMNELKPLVPSEPLTYSGEMSGGDIVSIPITLKQSERVQGTITGGLGGLAVCIADSGGAVVEDLGRVFQSSFTYTAETSGTYAMIIKEPSGLDNSYVVKYIVYQRQ